MKFHLEIPLHAQKNQIDYNSNILLLGSCFSENIGEKFQYYKFQRLQNPFGILFHPIAIERLVSDAVNQKVFTDDDIFFTNEQWHCFDAHSKLSNTSKDEVLKTLNAEVSSTYKFLKQASHIIITLGTAWTYRFRKDNKIVANCHKVPQNQFKEELLSIDEISASLEKMITEVKSINHKANFIFTVSPVRHIKDGFTENTLSKSHLIAAIHKLLYQLKSSNLSYFPSYEIIMDELRDYRFYKDDMLHPNQLAVNYIWEKFQTVWLSESTKEIMMEVEIIQKGLAHKPFHFHSGAHQKFLQNLQHRIRQLKHKIPHIQF